MEYLEKKRCDNVPMILMVLHVYLSCYMIEKERIRNYLLRWVISTSGWKCVNWRPRLKYDVRREDFLSSLV